jgi:glycosyltransferase involved in cell wall biosynthesis
VSKGRILFLPANNNALVDARVLRYVKTAGDLGYEAIALGSEHWEEPSEHDVPGGRVIIRKVNHRMGGRGLAERFKAIFRAAAPYSVWANPVAAKAFAAFMTRQARDPHASRPVRVGRLAHALALRATLKVRGALPAKPDTSVSYLNAEADEKGRGRLLAFYRTFPLAARWRIAAPQRIDDEVDLGPVIDQLEPDLIHVHDVYLLGVAVAAATRAAAKGRQVHLVYDAREYVPGLGAINPRLTAAHANLEKEYIDRYERIVTVSDSLADLLMARHHLEQRPDIVLNAPVVAPRLPETPDIRQAAAVPDGVPLLLYGGGVNAGRGVQTAIESLVHLPGFHLAVVIREIEWWPEELADFAVDLGVADRLHLVPFVPHDQVVHYFESADLGLSPLLHVINHDVALTNKFCEYLLAGLPIVTSDTPEQAGLVTSLGLGTVFKAGDAADLARAVQAAWADLPRLKARIKDDAALQHRFSWEAQVPVLERIYADLLG